MRDNRLRQLIGDNIGTGRQIQARQVANTGGLEVLVYDVIDPWFGVSAAAFAQAIAGADGKHLTVRVNSPGGDVWEGRAIASQIASHKGGSTVIVDGLAASAASTVAIAGDTLQMAKGAFLMVHNAWAFAMGNAIDLRQLADLLEKVDGAIAADYAAKAGVTDAEARVWMANETWFTAEEAVTVGLANAVLDAAGEMQNFNLAAYDRVPTALANQLANLAAQPSEAALRAAAERRMRLYEACGA